MPPPSPQIHHHEGPSRSILMRLSPSARHGKTLQALTRALPSTSCAPLGKLLNLSVLILPQWKNVIRNRCGAWVVVGKVCECLTL